MDHVPGGKILESQGCLPNEFARLSHRQWASLLDQLRKIDAIDVFHDYEHDVAILAELVDSDDIRVIDGTKSSGFAITTLHSFNVISPERSEDHRRDDLQCQAPGRVYIFAQIGAARAAGAQAFENLVLADG